MVKPDRKTQIISEATRLFSESGYDKVTVKQLADACCITEPALYRHYSSKEAIYDAVLDSISRRLNYEELFDRLRKTDDVELMLRSIANHILDYFSTNQDLYRLLLYSALRGHTKSKQVYQAIRGTYSHFLHTQLDRLFEKGCIIKKNNEITARCFIGMVFDCALGITLWKGYQGKEFDPPDVIANNVPIYVKGLTG